MFQNNLPSILQFIDLTSLNTSDSENSIAQFIDPINQFPKHFPSSTNVAAVCVAPRFVPLVRKLLVASPIQLAAVAAGFPMSQTSLPIKIAECVECVAQGANELDIVILVGELLAGNYSAVQADLCAIREAVPNTHLKVILETGALPSTELVRKAAQIAIESGADFIKTSTGKLQPAATPDAFRCMAQVAHEHYIRTGKMIGLKAAGGIVTPEDAITYIDIVLHELGEKWLTPQFFRLGASRLANNLLGTNYFN